jgi:hypothetical protein
MGLKCIGICGLAISDTSDHQKLPRRYSNTGFALARVGNARLVLELW